MQPAPRQDPRPRSDRRGAAENEDPGSRAIPIGAAVCGLDRLDTEGSFDRGQSEARGDHARRRRGIAQRAGGRGDRGNPASSTQRQGVALAGRAAQAQVAEVGRRGAANKMARIAWKLMRTGEAYTATSAAAIA